MRLLLEGGSSHLKPQAGRRECTGNGWWLLKPQSLSPVTYILHHGCNKALQIAIKQGQNIQMSENMGDTSHLNHHSTDRILQLMHQRTCLTFKSCQQKAFRRLWVGQVISCSVGPGRIDRNTLGEDSLCSMTQETFFIFRGGQSVNINIVCLPTLMSQGHVPNQLLSKPTCLHFGQTPFPVKGEEKVPLTQHIFPFSTAALAQDSTWESDLTINVQRNTCRLLSCTK